MSPDVSFDFVFGNIGTLWKTKLTVSLGTIHLVYIDYDGPLTDIETDNNVVAPKSHRQLTDHQSMRSTGHQDQSYSVVFKACAMKWS